MVKTRNHTQRREHRLALTREYIDVGPADLFCGRDELGPILGVTTRGRGDRQDFFDPDRLAQLSEAAQC